MHKNIERIISLALLGAINSNNAIALASDINQEEITQKVEVSEEYSNAEPSIDKTTQETNEDNLVSKEDNVTEEIITSGAESSDGPSNNSNSDEPKNEEIKDLEIKEELDNKEEQKDVNLLENTNIEEIENKENLEDVAQTQNYTVNGETIEITLGEGESIPDLTGFGESYKYLIVKTTGDKILTKTDFDNIRKSKIPNIDLSLSYSETIPTNAFEYCSFLETFKFPQGVKSIEPKAFYNCSNFQGNLIIPDTVTTIGDSAFLGCSKLTGNLNLHENITLIDNKAFYGCSGFTGNLIIPSSIKTIGEYTFYNCSGLDGQLILPQNLETIKKYAFLGCRKLSGNLNIPNSVTTIGSNAFYSCSGFTGDLIIPESVTSLGSGVFTRCSGLDGKLVLPESITSISDSIFFGCAGLSGKLIIPNSVTSIGSSAFGGCSGFTGDLIIPDSVVTIGANAFSKCTGFNGGLKLSNSLITISNYAFEKCSGLSGELVFPDSLKTIGMSAFYQCSGFTGDLIIPDSVTEISKMAFSQCSGFNGKLVLSNSIEVINDSIFYECSGFKGNLTIPGSVTSINYGAFQYCSGFTGDLIIPDSVTTIGSYAFNNCRGFDGVLRLSNTIKSIGEKAFNGCSKINGDLIIDDYVEKLGQSAFAGCSKLNVRLIVNPSTYKSNNYNISNNMAVFKNVILCIKSEHEDLNYGRDVFDELMSLNSNKIEIEVPYSFDIEKTWLKDYVNIIKVPTLSILDDSILDNVGNEIYTSEATLKIPNIDNESDIKIKKNNEDYPLPIKNNDGSYTFKEPGIYDIEVKTKFGTISNINFEVESFYGSTTVNYIDEESGKILYSETIDNLKIGEYEYNFREIEGYNLNDDEVKTINIDRANRNQTINFRYLKIIQGSVTVKYIDNETEKELIPSKTKNNLELDIYTYFAEEVEGYDLIGEESTSVELTRENPNKTIEFRYKKKAEPNQGDTIVVEKEDILNAIENNKDLKIVANNGALKIYKTILSKIKDLIDTITFTMKDSSVKNIKASNLIEKENLDIIDVFSIHSNLSELKDGHIVNVSRKISNLDNKTLYLYRASNKSRNASLQYIGEVNSKEGFVNFDIDSKFLDGSGFIISTNKISDKDEGKDNITDDSTNPDNIPSLGGLSKILSVLSTASILSGLYITSNRKKYK